MKPLYFFDSHAKKKTLFTKPSDEPVTFYSCGPTVYDIIHIGNLRGAVVADIAVRTLRAAGAKVIYVRNYTDIDDKIIAKAKSLQKTCTEVSEHFIAEVEKDYASVGNILPDITPRVTESLTSIINMIQWLIETGYAYSSPQDTGEIFFAVDRFQNYGALSRKPLKDLHIGERVQISHAKHNPLDFVLWKPAKNDEPSWDSPWGKGRPGWHIECSAMIWEHLGKTIDIHHGGEDLLFPHHENEIAQSEAATGCKPFARVWLHHAFVNIADEKMSKSAGNMVTARQLLEQFPGEVVRYFLLFTHYRTPIQFHMDRIQYAMAALKRLYDFKLKFESLAKTHNTPSEVSSTWWQSPLWSMHTTFVQEARTVQARFETALLDDLNVATALGHLFSFIRLWNRIYHEHQASSENISINDVLHHTANNILQACATWLGLGVEDPQQFLKDLSLQTTDVVKLSDEEIKDFIDRRQSLRLKKNYLEADAIRYELLLRGVLLHDNPQTTTWSYCF